MASTTRNTIVTAALTALLTSICTFFALDYVKSRKTRPKEVIVPQVVGLTPSQAAEVFDGRGLRMQIIERRPDGQVPAGQICAQSPLPDSKVLSHTAVNVVLSAGPPRMPVPTCAGVLLQEYTTLLTKAGLKLGKLGQEASETVKAGHVISCEPAPGQTVNPGTEVSVMVAKAADPEKEVPKVKGKSCQGAKKAVEEAGFTVETKWGEYEAPPYLCMDQKPEAGTKAKPGTPVTLWCSKSD
jgi:beta-lactam-binding protein with PASTA domain